MTPLQPSLLEPATAPRRRTKTIDAPTCQCGTYLLPGDPVGLDGKAYCFSCWASVPVWLQGTVPMKDWPRGWRKITGVKR